MIQERFVVPGLQMKNLEQTVRGPFEHVDSAKPRKKIPRLEALNTHQSLYSTRSHKELLVSSPLTGACLPPEWLARMAGLA